MVKGVIISHYKALLKHLFGSIAVKGDGMKYLGWLLAIALFASSCSAAMAATPAVSSIPVTNPTLIPTATSISVLPTLTTVPTVTVAPKVYEETRSKIRRIMEAYGSVDEYYLSDAYWDKLQKDIADSGTAKRILTLEFHGDNYWMYDGSYSLTPEAFAVQMDWLMKNNYHFVTIHETEGYIEGWLDLPAKSIILTTDSGGGSKNSLARITEVFKLLDKKYGYRPHMQSYIWTHGMFPEETVTCTDNACWQAFNTAKDSGYFSFGSHTQTHRDFSHLTLDDTLWDIKDSQKKILANLGIKVYAITWPFEACSPYENQIRETAGITIAYGGWSKPIKEAFTAKSDTMALCLPRLFPPNSEGYSGRPVGVTLEQMLDSAAK